MSLKDKHFETQAVRGHMDRSQYNEHSSALHLTSSFVFDDAEQMRARFSDEQPGNIYSRFSNPNTTELIQKICLLEGAEAGWATATGMAAVYSALAALTKSGDHIVSARQIFGSTHQLFTKIFPKWNIDHSYAELSDTSTWEPLINERTKILYVETPSNPGMEIIDLQFLGDLAKKYNLLLLVDNCFATPYLQQPLKYGAHLSIHSATKYIDGQGRVLGGLICGAQNLIDEIQGFARHTGPAMSPFNAWVLSKSIETLALRMDRHAENATKIATALEQNHKIEWVRYPFLPSHPQYAIAKKQMRSGGGMLSFNLKGGLEAGRAFLDKLQMCSLSANLGDAKSIVTHPASTTHAKLSSEEQLSAGITPGLVRVSVGLEHPDDILADILQALS